MRQRSILETALAIAMGLSGWVSIMISVLGLVRVIPITVEFPANLLGLPRTWEENIALVLGFIGGLLLLSVGYGLWKQMRWGNLLAAVIVAFELIAHLRGKSLVTFLYITVNGELSIIVDFSTLLLVVLLVTTLASSFRSVSTLLKGSHLEH
jgi:hypothetical protein